MFNLKLFKNRIFIASICVFLALAIGLVALPLYNNLVSKKVNVVVATQDIHPGTRITENMLKVIEMNAEGVPQDAAHSIEEVMFYSTLNENGNIEYIDKGISLYAVTTIMKDYYITSRQVAQRLVSPQSKIRQITPGYEAVVSIPLNNVSVPCALVPNNIVQILRYDPERQEYLEIPSLKAVEVVCTLAANGAEITEVNQRDPEGKLLEATRIQFILNREQARVLSSYSQSTKLAFFLIYAGDNPAESRRLISTNSLR